MEFLRRETAPSWQRDLARAIDRLGRWFEGRLVLSPGPHDRVVPAERFLTNDDELGRHIDAQIPAELPPLPPGHRDRRTDRRILASRFARVYSNAVTGAALVGLAHGIGLDLSPARCAIVFRGPTAGVLLDIDATRILRCTERPTTWPVGGPVVDTVEQLRAHVSEHLYGEHITALHTRIADVTNVSQKLLWCTSAEMVAQLHDAAEEYLDPGEAARVMADARALLDAKRLPGVPGGNPMRGKVEWVPYDGDGQFPHQVQVRRMCCLIVYLADRYGRLCQNCPYLPIDDQVVLIRERHGRSQTHARGAAEHQALTRGLAWLERRT